MEVPTTQLMIRLNILKMITSQEIVTMTVLLLQKKKKVLLRTPSFSTLTKIGYTNASQ